jgi:hypothetical protein
MFRSRTREARNSTSWVRGNGPLQHEHDLQHLLDGLLGVEANNVVGHLGVLGERHARPKVALGALR